MTAVTPMAQLAPDASYLLIEDQLDALGQKYRAQRLVRGFILWITLGIAASLLAALIAHCVASAWPPDASGKGPAKTAELILLASWGAWMLATLLLWVGKPMVFRPRNLEIARLIESRIGGLHNGLTNSVLLARATDLHQSPWLPAIFGEVLKGTQEKPLQNAIAFRDLKPLLIKSGCLLLPLLVLLAVPGVQNILTHGMKQMFSPGHFVPQVGNVTGLQVEPGNTLVIAGQPLEISISAYAANRAAQPMAHLVFDGKLKEADLMPTAAPDSAGGGARLHYGYRAEHLEQSLRYRVEVAGTQSEWYTARVVQQVKLQSLSLRITPLLYTRKPVQTLTINPAEIDKTPVSAPQGSEVRLWAGVDVPVKSAILQTADQQQSDMELQQGGKMFEGALTLLEPAKLSVMLMEGTQIVSRLPEQGILVQCIKDAPPRIEMRWPVQDTAVAPDAAVALKALLSDDYGLTSVQIFLANKPDETPAPMGAPITFPDAPTSVTFEKLLDLSKDQRQHGKAIRVQLAVTDNRNLAGVIKDTNPQNTGPQTALSPVYEIKFRDSQQMAAEKNEALDQLRAALMKMLALQKELNAQAQQFAAGLSPATRPVVVAKDLISRIHTGQVALVTLMQQTAQTLHYEPETRIVQKTLLTMATSVGREAAELSAAIDSEPIAKEKLRENDDLQGHQRRIIATLESLLAVVSASSEPATQPIVKSSPDVPSRAEQWEKLNEALKQFIKEEQRILDQTANLAKTPVDNFTDKDKQLLEDLKQAQDKLDAFMQQKISDFSKNAEQDMANAALLKDMLAVYSEVTMAKDALHKQAAEIAVADEENGLEGAKEISSNIEKWLSNEPDRAKWTQEDPLAKTDTPMPELPKELEDMVGKLMEEQEDLDQEMEDANANWTDSMDKGVGWDAADGPIADMSAKGVTGNQLPNDNEMAGRSGEGRSGKSQGEFVGDNAQGKGGRNTPTRLDPTPFANGQIKDESKDPVGGATGGGKLSGQGGQGLQGPVPPKMKQAMQRLADKQAQIRNQAERLQLQNHLGSYDSFHMLSAILNMRRSESDLRANRYQNAMRRRDVIVDDLGASQQLLGGQIHVQQDSTPEANTKLHKEINDAMKGDLPAAWQDALREYYKKLSAE